MIGTGGNEDTAARKRRSRARQRDQGMVEVQVTVPKGVAPLIGDVARILNSGDRRAVRSLIARILNIQTERRIPPGKSNPRNKP